MDSRAGIPRLRRGHIPEGSCDRAPVALGQLRRPRVLATARAAAESRTSRDGLARPAAHVASPHARGSRPAHAGSRDLGGSETYARELARALARVGRHEYGPSSHRSRPTRAAGSRAPWPPGTRQRRRREPAQGDGRRPAAARGPPGRARARRRRPLPAHGARAADAAADGAHAARRPAPRPAPALPPRGARCSAGWRTTAQRSARTGSS